MEQNHFDTPAQDAPPQQESSPGELEQVAITFGGGKGLEEARQLDLIGKADRVVADMFRRGDKSPLAQVVWNRRSTLDECDPELSRSDAVCHVQMQRCLETVRRHKAEGTLLEDGKISERVLLELGSHGYWGLLVPEEFGGQAVSFYDFSLFLTSMAKIHSATAGLASVHQCIGAVDPLVTFGSQEQKTRYLPLLASGERLSCFALTEPGAGSDLTAIRTVAIPDGDDFLLTGTKLFITNAQYGRLACVIALAPEERTARGSSSKLVPNAFIVQLPDGPSQSFQITSYRLHALRELENHGLTFNNFRVPKENILRFPVRSGEEIQWMTGRGLPIAFHGLNRGRVALCANAAGTMSFILADLVPWTEKRKTYGRSIGDRELVQRRLGKIAAYIIGAESLTSYCARLLDNGFRGEAECIVAKVFSSEAQKEVAIEYAMKTHGGRTFLGGNFIGDSLHDLLAPCIYEGEGEMLVMKLFDVVTKPHRREYYDRLTEKIIASARAVSRRDLGGMARQTGSAVYDAGRLAGWFAREKLYNLEKKGSLSDADLNIAPPLRKHFRFALVNIKMIGSEMSLFMAKNRQNAPDRQCAISDMSQKLMHLLVMLLTTVEASKRDELNSAVSIRAAELLCLMLRQKVTGVEDPTFNSKAVRLGMNVWNGNFTPIEGIVPNTIQQSYTP